MVEKEGERREEEVSEIKELINWKHLLIIRIFNLLWLK